MIARVSVLGLRAEPDPENPDNFSVTVLVDGVAVFAPTGHAESAGPYPEDFELRPPTAEPVRTLLATCSCRNRGCSDLAALVSTEEGLVMWRDFRRFTGWGEESELAGAAPEDGDPEDLPGLQFDLDQYVAEIQRFRDDRSWWTPTYTAYQIAAALAEAQLRNFERPR